MTFRITILCAAALFFLAAAVGAQEAVMFRYAPTKEPLLYRKVHTRKQTQTVMNKDIKTEMTHMDVSSWSAAKVKDNLEFKSETKLLKVKTKITGQEEYSFDSKKSDNEKGSTLGGALTPLFERLATAQFTFTVTPRGKILKLEGYKELLADVLKDNPLAGQFGGGGSEEAGKMMLGDYFIDLPEKGVQQGARWDAKEEIKLEKFGVIKAKRNFVYEGEGKVGKHKTAKISFVDELTIDIDIDQGGRQGHRHPHPLRVQGNHPLRCQERPARLDVPRVSHRRQTQRGRRRQGHPGRQRPDGACAHRASGQAAGMTDACGFATRSLVCLRTGFHTRPCLDIHENDRLNEARFASRVKQASQLPGERM